MTCRFNRAALAAAALVGCALPLHAAEFTMKIASGTPADPMALPASASLAIFEAKAEEYTGGRLDVQVFPDGQLGDQLSGLQQVKSGELQGSELAMGVLGNLFPKITFTDLPYVMPDMAVAQQLYRRDNPFMKQILSEMEDTTGVGVLFFSPQAYRQLTTKGTQVKTVADLEGLKIRTMQVRPHIEMFNATGARATPIPWLEVYSSLQTGVADGQENPLATIRSSNFNEVQDYITLTSHVHLVGAVTYNVDWFEGLPEDIQLAVLKAGQEASVGAEAIAPLYDIINMKWLAENGTEIYQPTPEEIAEFKAVMQPPAFEWFEKNIDGGDQVLADLEAEIARIQESFKALKY
ncbi:TRAP transporter substrate-binding protein [Poseidonocella sp. HB161398]|uniref:TRAP transporter substrate-binding protein n=1 Tax=Poseidonocella sp. HB161398 TaxID=2320855 RepID=UPI0011093AFC|nr:TRAP transporter substrate-binding protein [Poseidonocella sp. HB161398]